MDSPSDNDEIGLEITAELNSKAHTTCDRATNGSSFSNTLKHNFAYLVAVRYVRIETKCIDDEICAIQCAYGPRFGACHGVLAWIEIGEGCKVMFTSQARRRDGISRTSAPNASVPFSILPTPALYSDYTVLFARPMLSTRTQHALFHTARLPPDSPDAFLCAFTLRLHAG